MSGALRAFVEGNGYEVVNGLHGRHALPMDNAAPLAELDELEAAVTRLRDRAYDLRLSAKQDGQANIFVGVSEFFALADELRERHGLDYEPAAASRPAADTATKDDS